METRCLRCQSFLNNSQMRRKAKFCSPECRSEHYNKKQREVMKSKGYIENLSTGTRGAISELRVCSDLLSKGYEVFRAISPSATCDLAILKDGKLKRVEVRTTMYKGNGDIYPPNKKMKADVLVMVLPDKIIYEPSL